jgi:carboxymethylenebutenolidase
MTRIFFTKKTETMKQLFLTMALGFAAYHLNAQCCAKPQAIDQFAAFSTKAGFSSIHDEPKVYEGDALKGEMKKIATASGNDAFYYAYKKNEAKKYLLVFQEWWGLNDHIKHESDKYADSLSLNVVAIDLYDGKVATTREEAGQYMQSNKKERSQEIINTIIQSLGADAQFATVGWCFGGGWSMQASLLAGKQSKACIIYYGMPETDMEKIKSLNAEVLMVWPNQDQWINKEVVETFKMNMKTAKKKLTVKEYNANHAFANPSNPKYSKEMGDDAFKASIKFIKEKLK